jgi:urease accessory protein
MRIFPPRPSIIVDALPQQVSPESLRGKQADSLLLTWEQRRWMRGRFVTLAGREIGVALPTGIQVEPGQTLWIGPEWYLTLEAASESLLVIKDANREQAIRIAFEVGNLHFPLALSDGKLVVPDDSAMINLFGRIGVPWEKSTAPFRPIGKGSPHER